MVAFLPIMTVCKGKYCNGKLVTFFMRPFHFCLVPSVVKQWFFLINLLKVKYELQA